MMAPCIGVAGAQAVGTILYDGKPEYFANMVTQPRAGIEVDRRPACSGSTPWASFEQQ